MKKRIALLLVLVLALSFVLASCGSGGRGDSPDPKYLGFEGYYNTVYEDKEIETALNAATEINLIKDIENTTSETNGNLVSLENDSVPAGEIKYAVVNTDTGAVVYSLSMEDTAPTDPNATPAKKIKTAYVSSVCYGNAMVIVETMIDMTDTYKWTYTQTIYTALGVQIASSTNKTGVFTLLDVDYDLFLFEGKFYEMEDDVATYYADETFAGLSIYYESTDKYNYTVTTNDMLFIYDKAGALVASYDPSPKYYDVNYFVLADGNVVIQLNEELPYDASEYDYMGYNIYGSIEVEDAKYGLTTLLYNVEDKKAKEIDFDYYINSITNEATNETFAKRFAADKIENLATLTPIKDERLDSNNDIYVSLKNNLKVVGKLGAEVPNQYGLPMLIDNNRFAVKDKSGKTWLLNEKGEILADISGIDIYRDIYTDGSTRFIIKDYKIYNTSLELIIDENSLSYDLINGLYLDQYEQENPADGSKKVVSDYYTFYNGSFNKLTLPALENISGLEGDDRFVSYYERVPATDTDAEKNYFVVLNITGTEIFRTQIDTVTSENTETGVVTTVEKSVNATELGECVLISVITETTKSDAPFDTEYSVQYYIAK